MNETTARSQKTKLSAQEKDSLIVELWQTIQELKISLEKLEKNEQKFQQTTLNRILRQ